MFAHSRATRDPLAIVLQEYADLYQSNPTQLRLTISPNEMWRFMLDGMDHVDGFISYERREEGYMKAMMNGFQYVMDSQLPVNIDFIQTLHGIVLEDVTNTIYADIPYKGLEGHFRVSGATRFPLIDLTTSVGGLQSFIETDRYHLSLAIIIKNHWDATDRTKYLMLDSDSIVLLKNLGNINNRLEKEEIQFKLLEYIVFGTKSPKTIDIFWDVDFRKTLADIAACHTTGDLARYLKALVDESEYNVMVVSSQGENTFNKLRDEITAQLAILFAATINEPIPYKRLMAIIKFTQSCEQLHPFIDGNCRVFCMLLLNRLLVENGFPLTMMSDPNMFDMLTPDELMSEVIAGMQQALALARGEKLINGLYTEAYCELISDKDLSYFHQVVAIEESARESMRPTLRAHA